MADSSTIRKGFPPATVRPKPWRSGSIRAI